MACNFFLPNVSCLFTFLMMFEIQKFSILVELNLFLFVTDASDVESKNPLIDPDSQRFTLPFLLIDPVLSSNSFTALSVTLKLYTCLTVVLRSEVGLHLHCFVPGGHPAVPAPFGKEATMSLQEGLGTPPENPLAIVVYFWTQFYSIGLYVHPYDTTTLF